MIPETFRKSTTHRKLFATMEYLSERDPAGLVVKGNGDREVSKRAADRRRTILEHRAADRFRAYFREERAHVVSAFEGGGERRVDRVLHELRGDLRETYEAAWGDAAKSWGRWAARSVRRSVAKADVYQAPVDAWLAENVGKRITGITESSRKMVAAEIARGTAAGETLRQIARRIDRFYLEDIIPNRSMVIARTEVGTAVNWTQHFIASDADVPMEKEWLALSDDRTRDDHAEADGQRVELNEPFEVGADLLMYPGDPSGSPEEIINCRCSVLYHVVDEADKLKAAEPGAPSVDEFARQVVNVEGADVITALAFARGVFGEKDDWVWARRQLMKRVYHLRRAEVEKYSPDQLRDEQGRWTDAGVGSSYSPENARRAEAGRKYGNGKVLRYTGGSRAAINPGEHVMVRGVYGMSEKTGVVYYNVEALGPNSRRFTLADTTLRPPLEGEVPAAAAPPKPIAPRPITPGPAAPQHPVAPAPSGASPYSKDTTGEMIGRRLTARTGIKSDLTLLKPDSARAVAEELDRLTKKYPDAMPPHPGRSLYRQYFSAFLRPNPNVPSAGGSRLWGTEWANSADSGVRLNPGFFNMGNENPRLKIMTNLGWHPAGCDKLEDVVSHEFGHQLMGHLDKRSAPGELVKFLTQNRSALRAVSTYSKKNSNEAFAEGFSQIEAKESGRYNGELSRGALVLKTFLSDIKARGVS